MPVNPYALAFLDLLERSEQALIAWGLTDGFFSEEEVEERASSFLEENCRDGRDSGYESEVELIEALCDEGLLWRLPYGDGVRYRTRFAETVRLFASLRQIFPDPQRRSWRTAPRLVADYRLQRNRRAFPKRQVPIANLLDTLRERGPLSALQVDVTRSLLGHGTPRELKLAGFQVRASTRVITASRERRLSGTVVCAGTGSGKTLAFYLPAYLAMAEWLDTSMWTRCLAIYPRKELLKDQLREALANARRIAGALKQHGRRQLVIGALYGDVPRNAASVPDKWPQHQFEGRGAYRCPYLGCPECGGAMVWTAEDIARGFEHLQCVRRDCGGDLTPDQIRLTREQLFASPPDLLFTTTEMLNQRLSTTGYAGLFGVGVAPERQPRLMLMDEVHAYEGTDGAQVAYLLRRWRHRTRARPHFVGLSATLADAPRFFGELVGIGPGDVSEVGPEPGELEHEGAEYQLALRSDPATGTSTLSTSIQSAMLLRRMIAADSGNAHAGSRVFAFTDNLDAVNRLFHDLGDAEGRTPLGGLSRQLGSLANLRARTSPSAPERFDAGQNWALAEDLGHSLADGEAARVGRTSSQDPGVAADADIVVATSALEVGFDDPEVGAVLQHKAPQAAAAFLQRKGRAGRRRSTRPWTVVVLSDWGRDKWAYQSYERLFSPAIDAKYLPLDNPAIVRMQGTYALLDWLGSKLPPGEYPDPWFDLSSASNSGSPKARRQGVYSSWLRRLLDEPHVREEFEEYLRRALGISPESVTALLWDAPRPLLMGAVPTLLRRLESNFGRADAAGMDLHTSRGPLPDFVPATLFSDLQLPEVVVRIPVYRNIPSRTETMPFLQALAEFAPGRVSRRFGVTDANERHWINPGPDGSNSLRVSTFCPPADRRDLGHCRFLEHGREVSIRVFRPHALTVALPPAAVRTASNATLDWRTELIAPSDPYSIDVPTGSSWVTLADALRFCTHHLGSPVEIRRFVVEAQATVIRDGRPRSDRTLGLEENLPAGESERVAIGFATDVDAIEVRLTYPAPLHQLCTNDPHLLRGLRIARFQALVKDAAALDGIANSFQREWLAQIYLAAITTHALQRSCGLPESEAAVSAGTAALRPQEIAATILQWDDQGAIPGQTAQPRRLQEVQALLQRPDVMAALHDAADVLVGQPDQQWEFWLRSRFKATLGAALAQAAHEVCPQTDPDALHIDVAPYSRAHHQDRQERHDTLWLTEATVGGGGVIESLLGAYAQDPRRYFNFVEGALGPSDLETVAADIVRCLRYVTSSEPTYDDLRRAFGAMRTATSHDAKAAALADLRSSLSAHGVLATPTLLLTLNARVIGPGTNEQTDRFLSRIIEDWQNAEARLGIDVDARSLALAFSRHTDLETALAVTPEATTDDGRAAWRYGLLYGMLWLGGSELRGRELRANNPFAQRIECERLLVLSAVLRRRATVRLSDESWFEDLARELTSHGVAELCEEVGGEPRLAAALRRLGAEAIDIGGVLVNARLSSIHRDGDTWRAVCELPEAFQ